MSESQASNIDINGGMERDIWLARIIVLSGFYRDLAGARMWIQGHMAPEPVYRHGGILEDEGLIYEAMLADLKEHRRINIERVRKAAKAAAVGRAVLSEPKQMRGLLTYLDTTIRWMKKVHPTLDQVERAGTIILRDHLRSTAPSGNCSEAVARLATQWDVLRPSERALQAELLANAGCREVIPYLLRQLDADEALYRRWALWSLSRFEPRDHRAVFVDRFLHDSDRDVRFSALMSLGRAFPGECDLEIMQMVEAAYADASHTDVMRSHFAGIVKSQLGIRWPAQPDRLSSDEGDALYDAFDTQLLNGVGRLLAKCRINSTMAPTAAPEPGMQEHKSEQDQG